MHDKYIFETTDPDAMEVVASRNQLLSALYDLQSWGHALYNGKCYDTSYVVNGKIYSQRELMEAKEELPRDEHGFIKDCKEVYLIDDVQRRIDDIIRDVNDIINRTYN